MALSQLTRKQLMDLVEDQLKTINEQKERINVLERVKEECSNEMLHKNNSLILSLEMNPDYYPIDEFMLAGAIYRYCADSYRNLDVSVVVDMITNKLASERKHKYNEDDEYE